MEVEYNILYYKTIRLVSQQILARRQGKPVLQNDMVIIIKQNNSVK